MKLLSLALLVILCGCKPWGPQFKSHKPINVVEVKPCAKQSER